MSGRPFRLKGKRRTRNTNSYSSDDGSTIRPIDRYDSDGESIGSDTDSVGSGFKNFPELDLSPSPRSLSPMSTSSTGASGSHSLSPLTFGFNMETFEFTQTEKPSANLLEKSIASLPAGSDLKNTLLYIRRQLKHSLLRVKDLEEQVKSVPTLRVQNSVLQEEKRQLLKQLQSKCSMKKNRSYGYNDLYYNTLRQRGCKSDTEDDGVDDEFSSVRRKLRMKLSGSTESDVTTDSTRGNVCERCKSGITTTKVSKQIKLETFSQGVENIPHNRGSQTKIRGIDNTIWKSDVKKENDGHAKEPKDSNLRHKVSTRSIGVGMIRSFTKDCGVGSGIAELKTKEQTSQTLVEKSTIGCDALVLESFDKGISVRPYMESIACQTERTGLGFSGAKLDVDVESTATQTTIAEPFVSVGVGVCTIDEDYCSRCLSGEEFITTKSVDEIMAHKIEIPTYRSYGVGDGSLEDNYLCQRCWGVEVKEAACGDGKITINDLRGDMNVQADPPKNNSAKRTISTKSSGVGLSRLTDSFCSNCTSKRVRSVGIGNDTVSQLLCDRCTKVKTRSVGARAAPSVTSLGVGECCVTDSFCHRCFNLRTKTVGVGECCLSDSFCDRCFQLQTKCKAVGDYDVNDTTSEVSIDSHDNFVGLSMRINGHVNKNEIKAFANKNSTNEGTDSSEASDGGNSTLTHVSDTVVSDESSIDHDNPSSDSTGQMSEPSVSSSGHQRSRVRLNEEVLSACKLLNGHLYKGKEIGREQLVSCMSTVENQWFDCVTSPDCRAEVIKVFIKAFRVYIPVLLETIVNLRDKDGNNALHYAVSYNNWKVVNTILKTNCADVGLPNQVGYNAVMLAALNGLEREEFTDIARRLLELGDVNSKVEETGQTPLMLAVTRGRLDMVGLLLEAGADINAQDNECSTALMCACEHGHTNIARLLLSNPECNSILEDNEGSTALSIAMDRNFHDIALQIYGHSNFSYTGQRRKKLLV